MTRSVLRATGVGWVEHSDRVVWMAPDREDEQAVAHCAWAIREWPPGAIGARLGLLYRPLSSGSRPMLQWVWRVTPPPFGLDQTLATKIRRLKQAVGSATSELGPRRDEWVALQGLRALRDALVFGDETMVQAESLLVLTTTPQLLNDEARQISSRLAALGIRTVELTEDHLPAALRAWGAEPYQSSEFASGWRQWLRQLIQEGPSWEPRVVTARRAAEWIWPGLGSVPDPPVENSSRVYAGSTRTRHPVRLDLRMEEDGRASNVLVIGQSGYGKSFWQKVVIAGLLAEGWTVIVLDIDGEYRSLCEAMGGVWLDVTGDRVGSYPDPLTIPPEEGRPEEDARRFSRMQETVASLAAVLGGLDQDGKTAVEQAVERAWREHGVDPDNPATWDAPSGRPSMLNVWEELHHAQDEFSITAARRLWRFIHGSQRHLFQGRPVAWVVPPGRLVVWHLGNIQVQQGQDLSPEQAGRYILVWRTTWEWLRAQRKAGRWTAVVVDEGQRALPQSYLGASIADLATTIRKWNGILLFATNAPKQLWSLAAGQTIWDNTPVKVLFGLEPDRAAEMAQHLVLPPAVQPGSLLPQMAWLRAPGLPWVMVRADVPPEEAALYATKGSRRF
ncbi:DUF87 domain-containing protein [Candidatus Hydrogenisulfobacillus filiaventi]|uniref:DUF87 domain-containing protein n=1 Tax=Candidatus Hydrogenisulfobacillus filiaventi TaxID=2707344 RepID=A0A6F8ZIB6_9FIRM|nr:DUF87 domain-containing protein [Candidatus Hydrogenisulfobacillus filiaventi]